MHAICQTEWQLTEWPIQAAATPLRMTYIPTILLSNDRQTYDSSVGPIDIRKTCTSLPPCLRTGILLIESLAGDERRRKNETLPGAELAVLWNGPIRWLRVRKRERQKKHSNENSGTKTTTRHDYSPRSVTRAPELPRKNHTTIRRAHCYCHDKRRPVPYTMSADTRTARNVTRENPTRRARAKRVEKPRNDDINTHRRPPPPLGHGQYGVPLGLAAGKPAGWQEWNARLGLVRRSPRDVTVRKLARPSVTRYSTAQTTPSCTVDIWLFPVPGTIW